MDFQLSLLLVPGEDVFHVGIATHYCKSSDISRIEAALLDQKNTDDIETVLNHFCVKPKSEFTLSEYSDIINRAFDATSVEEIFEKLKEENSKWAQQTLNVRVVLRNALLHHQSVNL